MFVTQRMKALMLALATSLSCWALPASAQGLDALKGLAGGGGAASSLGSLNVGSLGNATGVVEYCLKNNYLGGGASGIKDQLMGKLTGSGAKPSSDKGFLDGAKGLLNTSDGQSVDLTGGGLKEKFTKQVCEKVLEQAKNLL